MRVSVRKKDASCEVRGCAFQGDGSFEGKTVTTADCSGGSS